MVNKNEMKQYDFVLKKMVSGSCVKLIQLHLKQFEPYISVLHISLGKLSILIDEDKIPLIKIKEEISSLGFAFIEDANEMLAERTKVAAIELIIHSSVSGSIITNSDYISEKLQCSYEKISKNFSKVTGVTLEKYITLLKIEKAKELILSDYSLSEIAFMLCYNSVQYLSKRFKEITGYTITEYKKLDNPPRTPLEKII